MLSFTDLAVTVAEADAYASARGWANWTGSDKEAALRRGQDFIASAYNSRWATEWVNDEAPDAVKYAIIEAARRELVAPGSLNPDYDPSAMVTKERSKVGPIEEEFTYARPQNAFDARPVVGPIDALLSGLLASSGAAMNFRITRS